MSGFFLGSPIGDSHLRDQMQKVIDEQGLPDVVFHVLFCFGYTNIGIEKCERLQKSISGVTTYLVFSYSRGYNRMEKCKKLQKSILRRLVAWKLAEISIWTN